MVAPCPSVGKGLSMHPFPVVFALAVMLVSPVAWAEDSASNQATQAEAPISTPPAAVPEPARPQVAENERVVCTKERTTGSNRIHRVCRSAEQIRREREAARHTLGKRAICSNCGGG